MNTNPNTSNHDNDRITGVLIDVTTGTASKVTIERSLEAYYQLLGCTYIEIVSRKIGGKTFDIICDEEGLFVDKPIISAVSSVFEPMIVGSLFVVKFDGEENETSLDEDDIYHVLHNLRVVSTVLHPKPYTVLVCDY